MSVPEVTMLNVMAGLDFSGALEQLAAWEVRVLDLKDCIFGKGVADLGRDEAARARDLIEAGGFSVHCLSTVLFHSDLEEGEKAFLDAHWPGVERIVEVAEVLQPKVIRLLAARSSVRADHPDIMAHIKHDHPWLLDAYRRAIDMITEAGYAAAIENEVSNCIFSTPDDVLGFFDALNRAGRVALIWDVQNLWQMGTFPSIEAYEALRPLIRFLHLKGGRHDDNSRGLRWASSLEDASWPVAEIVRRAVADGAAEVICLNPSHGERPPGFDGLAVTRQDLAFLHRILATGCTGQAGQIV